MKPVNVGIDPSLSAWAPEIKYVFRTLFRIAGLPYRFVWAGLTSPAETLDIYYGRRSGIQASIWIRSCERAFADLDDLEPRALREQGDLAFIDFNSSGAAPCLTIENDKTVLWQDIVFSSYWLLTGARETRYVRDRWDNLDLEGSFFLTNSLAVRPLVSMYGAFLRSYFKERGYQPLEVPWSKAFVFTHDVDYPQIIKWIECLRLAATRGWKALPSISGVLRGTNHFWTFAEWINWQKQLGARSAFYFMARQGSLLQYALGTPDDFYNIRTQEFQDLFRHLQDEGFEIGLHASYNAWRSVETLQREKELVEQVTGTEVDGNRHHYWHLNPRAPHETLALHEEVGLSYDSSLGLEYYPGFRRGICHPFRPYHPGLRREIGVVQLPPAWMDDHFDRRLLQNRIADPVSYARSLVQKAVQTGGIVVVDYHSRGMNSDFYPRYGQWLRTFIDHHLDSSIEYHAPGEITRLYRNYEAQLATASQDLTALDPLVCQQRAPLFS